MSTTTAYKPDPSGPFEVLPPGTGRGFGFTTGVYPDFAQTFPPVSGVQTIDVLLKIGVSQLIFLTEGNSLQGVDLHSGDLVIRAEYPGIYAVSETEDPPSDPVQDGSDAIIHVTAGDEAGNYFTFDGANWVPYTP